MRNGFGTSILVSCVISVCGITGNAANALQAVGNPATTTTPSQKAQAGGSVPQQQSGSIFRDPYFPDTNTASEPDPLETQLKTLTQKLKDAPSASGYLERGDLWISKRFTDKAIADYDAAVALEPRNASAYVKRGKLREDRREFRLAIADYTKAIDLGLNKDWVHLRRGSLWKDIWEYGNAINDFTQVIALNPGNGNAYTMRAECWEKLKNYQKALNDYNEGIAILRPETKTLFLARARVCYQLEDYEQALLNFSQALKFDPDDLEAHAACADLWSDQNEPENAISHVNEIIRIAPSSDVYLYRSQLWKNKKNYDKAIFDCDEALRINPGDPSPYLFRGDLRKKKGEYDLAIACVANFSGASFED